jgi:HEAT repeat protein
MLRTSSFCLVLLLAATSAVAQILVDVRLEKNRYLVGEPIAALVDVRNVGDEAVGYAGYYGDVRLQVLGAEPRVLPDIFGCFSSIGSGFGRGGSAHPPMLQPGETTTFWYLLKDYELRPGEYQLSVSGNVGVRWDYRALTGSPSPPPKHTETDPVPGAQFDHRFPLTVVAARENELRVALAPLVSDVDSRNWERRYRARAAIIESAPPFLEPLIARFAAENERDSSPIEALGRIASTSSRIHLKSFVRRDPEARRADVVLALARIGHRGDADFLAGVLQDETMDQPSRIHAAAGLGRIGGDRSVRYLERALDGVPTEVRPWIATALGNTRSRLAVPVLIRMFSNSLAGNEVCGALTTLTHQEWCDGTLIDSAAKRRQWLRRWNENRWKASIFGPDNCPVYPAAPEVVPPPVVVERSAPTRPPRIQSVTPAVVVPNSVLAVTGYALGLEDSDAVRVVFVREDFERTGRIQSTGREVNRDADSEYQYMDVVVPADLTAGRWEMAIDANGRRSAPVTVEITDRLDLQVTDISPERAHPAQFVLLSTKTPAQRGDQVQLIDARGRQWHTPAGISSLGMSLILPDEMADGDASVRVVRNENGFERQSEPLRFVVTSGPLPLKSLAVALMKPVAPGQWTDLVTDAEIEFEVKRVDRLDVEFQQGRVTEIRSTTGPDNVHVQVPRRLIPGQASVRTRTWIEQTASEWSAPVTVTVAERPVAPSVTMIETGPSWNAVW